MGDVIRRCRWCGQRGAAPKGGCPRPLAHGEADPTACERCDAHPGERHSDLCLADQDAALWRSAAVAYDECLTKIRAEVEACRKALPIAAIGDRLPVADRALAKILGLIGESETERRARTGQP